MWQSKPRRFVPGVLEPEAEAILAERELVRMGIPAERIHPERHSIDSATNLANVEAEGLLPADDPVAIVAHRRHLDRILTLIASKTLRRDYLGVVVPRPDSWPEEPESFAARVATRAILFGVSKNTPDAATKITKRAQRAWSIANRIYKTTDYHRA